MHSRKSIFKRGIVFLLSFFAMALCSYTSVKAAECGVSFVNDKTHEDEQYLTIGGDASKWSDNRFKVTGTGCSFVSVDSITVNGENKKETSFTTIDRVPGHYTIEYNYTYNDGESNKTGVAYRYIRILNSSFDTSNNYTLADFNLTGASIIDSFSVTGNYFSNFVVNETSTYLVVTDALGRSINEPIEIKSTSLSFVATRVLKDGDYYYLVGNNSSESKGIVAIYKLSITGGVVTFVSSGEYSSDNKYNSAYLDGSTLYIVGKNKRGYPQIDSLNSSTLTSFYTFGDSPDVYGEYKGVSVVSGDVYAVGYQKAETASYASDLFTYVNISSKTALHVDVLKDAPETVLNDIIYTGSQFIIVGESAINEIYSNGMVVTNQRQGYLDGIILKVSSDGTVIQNAYMAGSNVDDRFTAIKQISSDEYVAIGRMSDDATNMTYRIKASTFEIEADVTSFSSDYKINGIVSWNYGYAYYGEVSAFSNKSLSILGVYYPKTEVASRNPLFLVLDNRTFSNYETLNLVINTTHKYGDYQIGYGITGAHGGYYSTLYDEEKPDLTIDTTNLSEGILKLEYVISAQTGATIVVYRLVNVKAAPTPVDLSSLKTGILKWYVYNRSYSIASNSNDVRLDFTGFNYSFTGVHSGETIENMIDNYILNGNTSEYQLRNVRDNSQETHNEFISYDQTSAAFGSVEYAKKFAYYQEFSRVVRVEGVSLDELGAIQYANTEQIKSNEFYIYYIDYRGDNSEVQKCEISSTSITNCSNKGGYAFLNLNDIKVVIEAFLQYNNYFVSTRNTIYNGSIPVSQAPAYAQSMYTDEYVTSIKFDIISNLTLNVAIEEVVEVDQEKTKVEKIIYQGQKSVYFGGSFNSTNSTYTHSLLKSQGAISVEPVEDNDKNVLYYESSNYIFFARNLCYTVYYSYVNPDTQSVVSKGTSRLFCLDTIAPTIIYNKGGDNDSTHSTSDKTGISPDKPLFIESEFDIVGLDDLDPYSFIYVNGNRYPITCNDSSATCEEDVKKYIKQEFYYNKNNPMMVNTITFTDRMLNSNTMYFIIGTAGPQISIENEGEDGNSFTLVINFFETNPIISFTTSISQQVCNADSSTGCYSPASDDKKSITNNISLTNNSFNDALLHYIQAVNYRDNNNEQDNTIEIEAVDDVYTMSYNNKTISYIIEDGYFVEYEGYGKTINIDDDNSFTYDKEKYYYNKNDNIIQALIFDEDEQRDVVDESVPPITIIDGKFKFEEKGKEYQVVNDQGVLSIEVVAQKYEISSEKEIEIDGIVYVLDEVNKKLTYSNPEIANLNRIELEFTRTIADNSSNVSYAVEGGVDIPHTEPIYEKDGVTPVVDKATNQIAYEFKNDENGNEYDHFNLVDGIYTFTIRESFAPEYHSVEASINVKNLEMSLGYAKNSLNPLDVTKSKSANFDIETDTETQIALGRIDESFKYPIEPTIIGSSQLSSYANTYFVSKAVYASFDFSSKAVFTIKLYNKLNDYGLPSGDANDAHDCSSIIIYGNDFNSSPVTDEMCDNAETPMRFDSINSTTLSDYGITHVLTQFGFFAFNGEYNFYEISLKAYNFNEIKQTYEPSARTITHYFYIDATNEIEDTIESYIYNEYGQVSGVVFDNGQLTTTEGKKTVGDTTNIAFKIHYNDGSAADIRENKLLLMEVVDGTGAYSICNLYQLITKDAENYETTCRNFIDEEEMAIFKEKGELVVIFSATGVYQITFKDASKNASTYSFNIDKTPPETIFIGAEDELYNGKAMENTGFGFTSEIRYGILHYFVSSYVKNPTIKIRLSDLTDVEKYCYYIASSVYSTNRVDNGDSCIQGVEVDTEYSVTLPQDAINAFIAANFDGDVTIAFYGIDTLGNGSDANTIVVHFWVDYSTPTADFSDRSNLNENYILISDIENPDNKTSLLNTITVSSNDYSGKVIECTLKDNQASFSFIDTREGKLYTFNTSCFDIHDNADTGTYSQKFTNTIFMKFYEVDEDMNKTEVFNFGLPSKNGNARWIYITLVDIVGNESADSIILPIVVQDSIAPSVSVVNKENPDLAGDFSLVLPSLSYNYPANRVYPVSKIYLANTRIKVTFSEPIASIISCVLFVSDVDGSLDVSSESGCDYEGYETGKTYAYSQDQVEFIFANEEEDIYKIFILQVEDFAGLPSERIAIIIDRVNPNIGYKENGEKDEEIEYLSDNYVYGVSYANGGYEEHVNAIDDQDVGISVIVKYERYSPSITYNNYVKTGNKYVKVDNYSTRQVGITYYLLINENLAMVNNKECLATETKNGTSYCYVQDTQSYYYFDSLLEDTSGKVWKEVTQIDKSTIGVYRISYYAQDYSGNISGTIYKKVFVNDTSRPDIDIYDGKDTSKILYRNLTSNNDDNFQGKLNKSVGFIGTDEKNSNNDKDVRLVLYKCEMSDYIAGVCSVENQYLYKSVYYDYENPNGLTIKRGTSNIYNLGNVLSDGVYKLYAYDIGNYKDVFTSNTIYYDNGNLSSDEIIYSLTYNTSSFNFAINIGTVETNYIVHGNKYTEVHRGTYAFEYSEFNYYTVYNSSTDIDVYLIRYGNNGEASDISGAKAIGVAEVQVSSDNNQVTYTYLDSKGRIVYKVVYEEYNVENGLYLHETYHNIDIDNETVDICTIKNGINVCSNLEIVYKVISVTANIYEDGDYSLALKDRYGNVSNISNFIVDNTGYNVNKENNKATGINYWFSVPSQVYTGKENGSIYFSQIKDVDDDTTINVLDSKYEGNFNSAYFYAFASRIEAKEFLSKLYIEEITRVFNINSTYTFISIDGSSKGKTYDRSDGTPTEIVYSQTFQGYINDFILSTYTRDKNFSDSNIKQVAYTGEYAKSSMYKYVYLLVTKQESNDGTVTFDYTLLGDTCSITDESTQSCVKVNLKIVSAGYSVDLQGFSSNGSNQLVEVSCRMSGTGDASMGTGAQCESAQGVPSGATYVFVDNDYAGNTANRYHQNLVYYGITVYSEEAKTNYAELGDYIALDKFHRYKEPDDSIEDESGRYIWLNLEYVLLDDIMNTNLYRVVCTGNECEEQVYVTYVGRFNKTFSDKLNKEVYVPSISGVYYYNYYHDNDDNNNNNNYYGSKEEAMTALGVDSTYSREGHRSEGANGEYVPLKINETQVIADLTTSIIKYTNKKAYIELFDEDTIDKLFEVERVSSEEVYSYVTLSINGEYRNINDDEFRKKDDNGKYKWVIDITLERDYNIYIIDRAGNNLHIRFSHSAKTPEITYTKTNQGSTSSNAQVNVTTSSQRASISKDRLTIYKQDATNEYQEYNDNVCVSYLNDNNGGLTRSLTLEFKYNVSYYCSGVYKIAISDDHGNTNYKEFVFNPYNIATSYQVSNSNNVHEYLENDIFGVIVNKSFSVNTNGALNYIIVNKYESYSNLVLESQTPLDSVTIKNFVSSTTIGACPIYINQIEGDVYSITISGQDNHVCDGIYTFQIIDRFSENIVNRGLTNLEGADPETMTSMVTYGGKDGISISIEIDTISPNTHVIDSDTEQYFAIQIDDEAPNYVDTKTLIQNRVITYTNKYITISWGGFKDYSLTYLKYRQTKQGETPSDNWQIVKDNVTYDYNYGASYKILLNNAGVYNCEFMFTDAVGNEDAGQIFTIIITITPPQVAFFEVSENNVIGDVYEDGVRIADKTILRCLQEEGSSYIIRPCTKLDYVYKMYVNGKLYPNFSEDNLDIKDIISHDSYWLKNTEAQFAEELKISLEVEIIGKPDIKTELNIIIDKKAPKISISGTIIKSIYTGEITVSLDNINDSDDTNSAIVYKCDKIEEEKCMIYRDKDTLIEGGYQISEIVVGQSSTSISSLYSGYFMVIAQDELGNVSQKWFAVDNEAPTISVIAGNIVIAPNMYTNANNVFVNVVDELSTIGSNITIEFVPFNKEESSEITYNSTIGFTKEGKYTITPIDGVNIPGKSITFYINRHAPLYFVYTSDKNLDENIGSVKKTLEDYFNGVKAFESESKISEAAVLIWDEYGQGTFELMAPIVSVTIDGHLYNAQYNKDNQLYIGDVISERGNHIIVISDAAGNQNVLMLTINNTNKVCINGKAIEVKMQNSYTLGNYKVDISDDGNNSTITYLSGLWIGAEKEIKYEKDDVIIFALPSQVSSGDCVAENLLGYRTLDPKNSHYLIDSDRTAELFNKNRYDFESLGFISKEAISEINNIGGTVVVLVVTKDIANNELGYRVGTNFFVEDPIGWTMIFLIPVALVWPTVRIFVKKKVRVI